MEISDYLPQAMERIRRPLDIAMVTLQQIIFSLIGLVVLLCLILPLLANTSFPQLYSWFQIFESLDPYLFAGASFAIVMVLSVTGAGWGIYLAGSSIMGACIRSPEIRSRQLIG
jgi:hypothetical protein